MYKVYKSVEAEDDLTDIWARTLKKWGIEQADKYGSLVICVVSNRYYIDEL